MPQSEISATIYPSTASIPEQVWDDLAQKPTNDVTGNKTPHNPFLRHAFFLALEQSQSAIPQTGWQPQHIVLSRNDKPVALMPLFLKSHSQGEYVFDHGWADAFERAGGAYYPKLQASLPFTPATCAKLLVPTDELQLKTLLLNTSQQLAEQLKVSSVHATFIPQDEERLAEQNGWLTRQDIQFHWSNKRFTTFDDFLSTLSARKRKMIRRERKMALEQGIKVEWIEGKDITETHWDGFFAFYQDTGARKWGRPYLTREFFSLLSQNMPENLVLMLARRDEHHIAGALNFVSQNTLYGRYWGCTEEVPFLHFELCFYQAIDYAIAHSLQTVEAGAQGGHKLARGYEPVITRSIHWIENPGLRNAVSNFLAHERAAISEDQKALFKAAPFKKSN